MQRLQSGTYGDIYNFPVKEYEKVLAMEEMEPAGEESEEEEEVSVGISFLYFITRLWLRECVENTLDRHMLHGFFKTLL